MGTGSNPPGSEEPVLNVVGERVALGPLRAELLPLYGRWINDFRTIRMLGLPPAPVTAGKEQDWYEGRSKGENDMMLTSGPPSRPGCRARASPGACRSNAPTMRTRRSIAARPTVGSYWTSTSPRRGTSESPSGRSSENLYRAKFAEQPFYVTG